MEHQMFRRNPKRKIRECVKLFQVSVQKFEQSLFRGFFISESNIEAHKHFFDLYGGTGAAITIKELK